MKRSLVALLLLTPSTTVVADGWADLAGNNRAGLRVEVSPSREWHDVPPEHSESLFHVTVSRSAGGLIEHTYPDQRCKFVYSRTGERTEFSCAPGTSPLAGTTYKIIRNPDPDDCSYKYRYVCTTGCNQVAPSTMLHEHWECGDME